MNNIILVSRSLERLDNNKGYVTTFMDVNRETNVIISAVYVYHQTIHDIQGVHFSNFQTLQEFINKL